MRNYRESSPSVQLVPDNSEGHIWARECRHVEKGTLAIRMTTLSFLSCIQVATNLLALLQALKKKKRALTERGPETSWNLSLPSLPSKPTSSSSLIWLKICKDRKGESYGSDHLFLHPFILTMSFCVWLSASPSSPIGGHTWGWLLCLAPSAGSTENRLFS